MCVYVQHVVVVLFFFLDDSSRDANGGIVVDFIYQCIDQRPQCFIEGDNDSDCGKLFIMIIVLHVGLPIGWEGGSTLALNYSHYDLKLHVISIFH